MISSFRANEKVVTAVLKLFPSGCLKSMEVAGHAEAGSRGHDPLCAAVAVLTRTMINALRQNQGVRFTSNIPGEGNAKLEVSSYEESVEEKLQGMTDFLLTGLSDLAAEHPRHITIMISNLEREV